MVSCKLEPQWRPLAAIYQNHYLTRNQKQWLLNPGSMTKQLQEITGNLLEVENINLSWEKLRYHEQQSLKSPREVAFIREVDLSYAGKILIKGRTVLPLKSLKGKLSKIPKLGNRPLGSFLFSQPGLQRSQMRWCFLYPHQISSLSKQKAPLLARESIFHLDGKALLLVEFFMPDLLRMIA